MRYYCSKCRAFYDESETEARTEREYRGECHGTPAYEKITYIICPKCGREVDEEVDENDV